jgi:hypothetical protein
VAPPDDDPLRTSPGALPTTASNVRRMTFKGWPEQALAFYEGLEADNSKA